jgi:tRNA modification GTPase
MDTIAAISTTLGPAAARVIVRLSGPDAATIANRISLDSKTLRLPITHFPSPGTRGEGQGEGLRFAAHLYRFTAPHSYTGEDIVEFHVPGNPVLAKLLLEELLKLGARLAEPGEFTARAYFNGRVDLTEAEGIAAQVSAQNEAELHAARQLMSGELSRRLREPMDLLAETLGLVEVGIDFSEEDVTVISHEHLRERINRVDAALDTILRESVRFEKLSHEPQIALIGRPNAGKSTLLNALARSSRAVVSPVAGTTRDIISAHVPLQRGIVRILDAAGLEDQPPSDPIERQMHDHALRLVESADFVVLVRDITDVRPPLSIGRAPDFHVLTKSDLANASLDDLCVSAHTDAGMSEFVSKLDALAFGSTSDRAGLALNVRHVLAITESRASLDRARHADASEFVALELRETLDFLGTILGSITPDDLLGRIFATFCIGK